LSLTHFCPYPAEVVTSGETGATPEGDGGLIFRILVLLSFTALGGCGLVPPAISIASFAADALSYAVSGKSVSDHGLSMVMREDCAVFNFVQGEAICAPGPHPQIRMVTPRDPEIDRTLLASAEAPSDAVGAGPKWAPPAGAGLLPVQHAAAGPLLDEPLFLPASLPLEPLASGPVGLVAELELVPPPV
jgi:hypothetical protein